MGTTSLIIVIPNSVTEIGEFAFADCSELTNVSIPVSVKKIGAGAFGGTGVFENSPDGLFFVDHWICGYKGSKELNTSIVIPEGTIGIADFAIHELWTSSITLPNSLNYIGEYNDVYTIERKVIELPDNILFCSELAFYDEKTTLLCREGSATLLSLWESGYRDVRSYDGKIILPPYFGGGSTQTTITLNIINYNSFYQYSCNQDLTNDRITVTDLFPEESVDIELVISTNDGKKQYIKRTSEKSLSVGPYLNSEIGPTYIKVKGYYREGDANVTYSQFFVNNKPVNCDSVVWKGLDPENAYGLFSYVLTVTSAKGVTRSYEVKNTIKNNIPLTIKTLQPKVISLGDVIVAAETNINIDDENVGFEWRRTDWTDDFQSKSGNAYLYEGAMEGYIRSLNTEKLWKYRAYYESTAGYRYYGDWVGIDPTDVSYFEPTVHTYSEIIVDGNTASVRGYAQRGTDKIKSQGFMYWEQEDGSRLDAHLAAVSIPKNAITIESSGTIMEAELTGLTYSANYCYVAFVNTSEGETFYGKTRMFSTGADLSGIEETTSENVSKSEMEAWFDIRGQMLDKPQRGLNILLKKDGTVRKIIVK